MVFIADIKVSLHSSQADVTVTKEALSSLPLWVVKLKIRINVTELLFQKFT